jgi:hypothetical protein
MVIPKLHALQPHSASLKVQEQQETKRNEHAQDDRIPSLLGTNPINQIIDAGKLRRGICDAPINTRQRFPLQRKTVIDGIRLAQYTIRDLMAIIQPPSFVQHVIRLCLFRICGPISVNVGAHIGQ